MTGVEGYVESAASGLIAGMNAARLVLGKNSGCISAVKQRLEVWLTISLQQTQKIFSR